MFRRSAIVVALMSAGILLPGQVSAGEPVQMKGSTSVELPKPSAPILEKKGLGYGNKEGANSLQGGFVAPPRIEGAKLLDKKARELLDKDRNWIFVNPYESHHDDSATDFLKGEKSGGIFDKNWMSNSDEKSQMQKFMEEKDQNRAPERDMKDRDTDNSRFNRDSPVDSRGSDIFGLGPDAASNGSQDSSRLDKKTGIFFEKSGPVFGDSLAAQNKFERTSPISSSLFPERARQTSVFDKDAVLKEQERHDTEFGKFLTQPHNSDFGLPSSRTANDILNTSIDATRLETDPVSARRSEQFLNFGRGESPIFSSGGSGAFAGTVNPNRALGDINAKEVSAPRTFTPPPISAPRVETPAFSTSPFHLPFPQRKF